MRKRIQKSRPMNKPNLVSAYKLTGKTVAQAAWQLEHQRRRRSLPFGLVMKQFFTIWPAAAAAAAAAAQPAEIVHQARPFACANEQQE
ncbi:hypothetical protein T4E_5126 [Trichinella pseudospiralis]|uniref:Uncharacterized protein n=1 Tax=Trichinella pseudospiralis TaxID=6337 RepID=A0A0V0XLU3_TRIPS|nr:hypothetical protein T4E_5126 [Trichinella pseudospiralis]